MANVVPFSFKGELMSGTHNFSTGGDAFKIALYTSNPYDTSSTVALILMKFLLRVVQTMLEKL